MNFYIGDSIDNMELSDSNVEFNDELINFIYKLRDKSSFDMSKLYEIDPYDDIEIPNKDVFEIIKICRYILDLSLLEDYEEYDEGNQMLKELLKLAECAIKKGKGLISIGD
ncbi:hypothetical protein [Clostridium sp. Marseille-P2415]|uniref:hypothetical protein n=1 Tax=Clostridium sp. Marseille-P2415 TaxID=1805471 RepID=UPI00098883E5|nr:hypothetical protein [Clostridium sp. Marseille-P2415]